MIASIREQGRATWDAAPARYAFGRAALWRFEGSLALEQLESLVAREVEANAALGITSTAGGAQWFDRAVPGIAPPRRLRGSSDRVDRGPGVSQLVDYKTGRPSERSAVENGRLLQLQLYALAARDLLGDARLVERYAFLRPPRKTWQLDSAVEADRALLDEASRVAAGIRDRVGAGVFHVVPSESCPRYCAFQHACRVNPLSKHKAWQ